MSDLEIFQIAGAIALALKGEKEAIADVELLLKRHPEMFEDIRDVFKKAEDNMYKKATITKLYLCHI